MAKDDNALDEFFPTKKSDIAKPYVAPEVTDSVDYIEDFGTPVAPSIERKLDKAYGNGQSKKPNV
jgi:hypothetical protein